MSGEEDDYRGGSEEENNKTEEVEEKTENEDPNEKAELHKDDQSFIDIPRLKPKVSFSAKSTIDKLLEKEKDASSGLIREESLPLGKNVHQSFRIN